jgi:hypothetical protein
MRAALTAAAGCDEGPRCIAAGASLDAIVLLRADAGGPPLPAHSSAFMTSAIVTTHSRVDTGWAGQLAPADAHCSSEGEHRCLIMRR